MSQRSVDQIRIKSPRPTTDSRAVRAVIRANRMTYAIACRWVLAINVLLAPWAILPILAPWLESHGFHRGANLMYAMFLPFCHQREDRSFTVFGERMACCHRCTAMYSGMFILGLAWIGLRDRVRPAPWLVLGLCVVPLALDGSSQLVGIRDSFWQLRVMTGIVLAVGVAWVFFPRLENSFADMRTVIEDRFDRLVAQGRATPLRGQSHIESEPIMTSRSDIAT